MPKASSTIKRSSSPIAEMHDEVSTDEKKLIAVEVPKPKQKETPKPV